MKKILFPLMAFAMLFISCEGEEETADNCIEFQNENVDEVNMMETFDAAGHAFQVVFHCSNGCGDFDSFEETTDGNTKTIKVLAKYDGCICDHSMPERSATYTFNPTQPGTYTLNFVTENGEFITKTVVVN